ncbi:hypothetical protein PGT21_006671 [Puccinia graminis f. sp. tritici]|uniref:Zn(2)-C6 fungal-type domain-containing protein n=2 Tax=Puccinia graminis f. sp. tritici TaxID=56615 RepID=A0A5B0QEH2_PUCGR|nr:hypothetical protein PGT21_006671 [Puccinia graminis f. sp. tritici]
MDLNEIDYELGLFLASAPGMVPEASTCQIQSSSAEDLAPKREVKGARRVRNACLQCRERKIRCSRTYPCKGCVSRGDGAACDWQGGFPTGNIPIYQKHAADQRREIEKLKDRLTSAKACLGSALQNNPNFKLEVGHHQTRPAFILPTTPREESLSWFSTGSNDQPPGSALSNISSFSANTVDSSQGWSHDEATSPTSATLQTTIWKERNPSRLFEMRHKTTGYRPLSLLREEDELAVQGSRPYTASHPVLRRATSSDKPLAPGKPPIHSGWSSDFLDSIVPRGRIPHEAYEISNSKACQEAVTPEGNSSYHSTSDLQEGMPAVHRIHFPTSLPPNRSNWQYSAPKDGRAVHNHEGQSGNPAEVESQSPITPSRHNLGFSLPYISSLRADETLPGGVRNTCQQHYLPQRQYLGGQDVEPITRPTMLNTRDIPWSSDGYSPNLEQRIQSNVAVGLVNMGEQYSLLPSTFGIAPTTSSSSQLPTYNPNNATNWPPVPR